MDWQLHWLEAEGDLSKWREQIATEVAATYTIVSRLITPPRLDILLQRGGMVIAEIGMVGQAYRKGLFALTLDPDNPNFTACLGDGTLRRQITHEVHHCLRMGGPGYGRYPRRGVGQRRFGWPLHSSAVQQSPGTVGMCCDGQRLDAHRPDKETLSAKWYNHAEWFFGTGSRRPRWLGYTLGYRIVGDWLAATPAADGDLLVNVAAETVLSAASTGVLSIS